MPAGMGVVVRAAAPSDDRSTDGIPTAAIDRRPADSHATPAMNSTRPTIVARSICQPRTSSRPRRKIGSADANRTAKIMASGRPRRRPRATGAHRSPIRLRGVPSVPGSRLAARDASTTRGGPATTASSVQAAIVAIIAADRRVTASPENAAIDAPRNRAAAIVSSRARNGSARIATNAARTTAVSGSQASNGSGTRSRRRSSQPAPRAATTRIAMLMPNAGPSRTTSPTKPRAMAATSRRRATCRSKSRPPGGRRGQARVDPVPWGRLGVAECGAARLEWPTIASAARSLPAIASDACTVASTDDSGQDVGFQAGFVPRAPIPCFARNRCARIVQIRVSRRQCVHPAQAAGRARWVGRPSRGRGQVAPCGGDGPGRTLRPDRRGLCPVVGAVPRPGGDGPARPARAGTPGRPGQDPRRRDGHRHARSRRGGTLARGHRRWHRRIVRDGGGGRGGTGSAASGRPRSTVSRSRSRPPTICPSPMARSTPRCRRSCSSSSRTATARCARSAGPYDLVRHWRS